MINAEFIAGLSSGSTAMTLSGNKLFLGDRLLGTVGEYDATTGAVTKAKFIAGLRDIFGLAIRTAK